MHTRITDVTTDLRSAITIGDTVALASDPDTLHGHVWGLTFRGDTTWALLSAEPLDSDPDAISELRIADVTDLVPYVDADDMAFGWFEFIGAELEDLK